VTDAESRGPGDMWGSLPDSSNSHDDRPEFIYPFNEDTTVDDVHAHPWPDPAALDFSGVKAECEKYHGKYATFGAPWSPFFHEVGWLVGEEEFLIWMMTKPEVVHAIIDHIVDFGVTAARRFLEATEGKLDIAYFGNDFGTQRGLLISTKMWGEFIRAPLKRYYDVAHEFGCQVMQHSCGSVRDLVPWLIEDGVDVLNPVQVAAAGMALPGLVRDFGGRICFYGAVDTQKTLPFGSPTDVRNEVRSYLDLTRDHGGYILAGSQVLIEDIPLDNILAMYDENTH
jgi:uroporphyrinogen decarboxylase